MTYGIDQEPGTIFSFKDISLGTNNIPSISNSLKVYPNPSNGRFTIKSSVISGQLSLEVYNVVGEKVYSQFNIQNSIFNIDLSSQPNGIYFYRVIENSGSLLGEGKIVIEK